MKIFLFDSSGYAGCYVDGLRSVITVESVCFLTVYLRSAAVLFQ